jgi:ABC-type multidrug transport system permease subunit
VASKDAILREPGARYIDFLVPGLIGMGIMGNGIWGMGFAVVDARRRKLLKRIVATPMPRYLYLASFLGFRLILLPVEVAVPVVFGALVFGVPVRGAIWDLVLLALLGSFAFSAIGLALAARPRTIEAAAGLMNVVMMPMWLLSGIFFSSERFPAVVQPLIRVLPLTALIDALRANMLQGTALVHLLPQAASLAVWTVVCFAGALASFRWR